jgi:hypothetical protein
MELMVGFVKEENNSKYFPSALSHLRKGCARMEVGFHSGVIAHEFLMRKSHRRVEVNQVNLPPSRPGPHLISFIHCLSKNITISYEIVTTP